MGKTIAAIATPPGYGGIAVIRISGENAFQIADKIICLKNKNKSLLNMPGYSAALATVHQNKVTLDEVVVLVFRAPNSFTGENVVEISCHGGNLISGQVLQACLAAGANMAKPGEFTKRSYLNGKISLTQAESVVGLISAESAQEAACANRAREGKILREINTIKSELIYQAAHLSAWIDYPEEGVPEPEERAFISEIVKIREHLDHVLQESGRMCQIKRGINVVISGSPNVGKSTLFNLMVGSERAITTPVAGTTRDVLREEISLEGYPIFLMDTAGLRNSDDPIEAEGVRRSNQEIMNADIIITVMEAGEVSQNRNAFSPHEFPKPHLCILNKSDLGLSADLKKLKREYDRVIVVSAKDQPEVATATIRFAIGDLLNLKPVDPDAMILMNQRQVEEAQIARDLLLEIECEMEIGLIYDIAHVKLENAMQALCSLTGENASAEIIEEVFSRFCVGK